MSGIADTRSMQPVPASPGLDAGAWPRSDRAGLSGGAFRMNAATCPIYVVDADERVLDASMQRYALRFGPAHLPPENAFWALALYGLPENMVVRNPLNRYLINSVMLPDLRRDVDGGLTLCIEHESPGRHWECNWLPAPKGPFFMALSLYLPKRAAIDRSWVPPSLQRVD